MESFGLLNFLKALLPAEPATNEKKEEPPQAPPPSPPAEEKLNACLHFFEAHELRAKRNRR